MLKDVDGILNQSVSDEPKARPRPIDVLKASMQSTKLSELQVKDLCTEKVSSNDKLVFTVMRRIQCSQTERVDDNKTH